PDRAHRISLAVGMQRVELLITGGQPLRARQWQFGNYLAIAAVVDGDLVHKLCITLDEAAATLLDDLAALGQGDQGLACGLVAPRGHRGHPAGGEVAVGTIGPLALAE